MSAEVEETIKRIQSHKGVQGVIVINNEGIVIKSNMEQSLQIQYAGIFHNLLNKTRNAVRDLDPQNDLTFLRIRTKKNEIMIAPDKEYMMIVVQHAPEYCS